MYKEVMIERADGKDEPTPLMANAATALRYKQIFHNDLLTLFANAETEKDGAKYYNIDFLPELTFVMAMQARAKTDKGVKLDQLSLDNMIDWLEDYDSLAIENASREILSVYLKNTDSDSEAKKNNDEQKEA